MAALLDSELRRNGVERLACDETLFVKVVKASFGQRRKMLRQSLKGVEGAVAVAETLGIVRKDAQAGRLDGRVVEELERRVEARMAEFQGKVVPVPPFGS